MKTCICKKDYERIQYKGYTIDYIIDFEKDELYDYIPYYSNKEDKNYKHYMLYPDNEPISLDKDDFDEYFVDVQKLRKLKLEKINGIASR